ncbi:hypothetical protein EVAR_71699_1 [Eumeta japonica]|uniref:Uncharacterized protein n=1 Tax=Eumeta variegata TaxID=151549 RepID=A0A4C1TR88_EUMVA|nr:hypothetical protein EVAR_71699_1 [Eumeta japonica]
MLKLNSRKLQHRSQVNINDQQSDMIANDEQDDDDGDDQEDENEEFIDANGERKKKIVNTANQTIRTDVQDLEGADELRNENGQTWQRKSL